MGSTRRRTAGLAIAAAAGLLAVAAGSTNGMPGDAWFVPAGIAAGFVAMAGRPGWEGLAAALGGMAVGMSLTIGLVQFGTAVYTALISYGAVVGVALLRLAGPPVGSRRRDPVTWSWVGAAILLGAALAWVAVDMARNPF